ncbi:hypothetical protein WICPIJ_001407 [Wickerhamomyces pijperi]|uniref:Outer spore wall protein RRT8 n=1 Tax=Wickerhamomyces pijperi TaxID=599730 RepID=A0A9P8QDJ7_WICPI|nr:hypothetical protein WICPIJ_001407 [Wickerhamomyces pijperi]
MKPLFQPVFATDDSHHGPQEAATNVFVYTAVKYIEDMIFVASSPFLLWFLIPVVLIHYIQMVVLFTNAYCSKFAYGERMESLFDTVLSRVGHDEMVLKGRMFRRLKWEQTTTFKRLVWDIPNNYLMHPFTVPNRVFNYLVVFVPVIGPLTLIFTGAPDRGFNAMNRYFQLRGINTRQKNAFYASRRSQFILLGIVIGILEQIPLLSPIFVIAQNSGAALWAGRCEERFHEQAEGKGVRYLPQQNRGAFIMGPP